MKHSRAYLSLPLFRRSPLLGAMLLDPDDDEVFTVVALNGKRVTAIRGLDGEVPWDRNLDADDQPEPGGTPFYFTRHQIRSALQRCQPHPD